MQLSRHRLSLLTKASATGALLLVALAPGLNVLSIAVAQVNSSPPISFVVKDGKLVSGPRVVQLKRDEPVTLTIVSDRADELHVHGYDLHLKLEPLQAGTLSFIAKHTGRFGFELHKTGLELGVLEIYPK